MLCFTSELPVRAVTKTSFRPFGIVVEMGSPATMVNGGTALRHDVEAFPALSDLLGFRLITSLYEVQGQPLETRIGLLERHPNSAQMIMPLGGEGHIVIVCHNAADDSPDLRTLKAFWFSGEQGMIYKPGLWHHPIFALDKGAKFLVQSWQNGTDLDCETRSIAPQMLVARRDQGELRRECDA